jgi:xanthine dehydrogenase accessory factor
VPYVCLVACRSRGPTVLDAMLVAYEQRKSVHTPAGLDIGARTAPAVALSILAEIVASHQESSVAEGSRGAPAQAENAISARDPVCGMIVAAVPAAPQVETSAETIYFCGTGCRTAYLDNPAAYHT